MITNRTVRTALEEAASSRPEILGTAMYSHLRRDTTDEGSPASGTVLADIGRILFENQLHGLGLKYGIPVVMYDHLRDYADNSTPPIELPPTRRFPPDPRWTLLGHRISLPIGVPSSVLTANSAWSSFYARLGYNVITTKTVRARQESAYIDEPPNWLFAGDDLQLLSVEDGAHMYTAAHSLSVSSSSEKWPHDIRTFSTVNSFGVPSPPPDVWEEEVAKLLRFAGDDQLVIVSVAGDYDNLSEPNELAADFATAATMAADAGASVIELNLSCPNHDDQQPVCADEHLVEEVVQRCRSELRADVQLVVKMAYLPAERLKSVVMRIADAVDGISGINTVPVRPVDDATGRSPFGRRRVAGLSGFAIRDLARDFVKNLAALRREQALSFDILASGGVMTAEDALALWQLGADCVQSATGANFNIHLAAECYDLLRDESAFSPRRPAEHYMAGEIADAIVARMEEHGGRSTLAQVMLDLPYPPDAVDQVVTQLIGAGLLNAPESSEHHPRVNLSLHLAS